MMEFLDYIVDNALVPIPVLYSIGTFLKGLEIINDEILLNEDGKLLIN